MQRPHLSTFSYMVPNLTVAAYSALIIALIGFGLAVSALSIALVALLES